MPLETYNRRRDFSKTPEPQGTSGSGGPSASRFTIQKHAAQRLHYDLRLEHGGVLWSWAVTRGPSLDPAEKRLAVRTEDHPIDYADFEGVIPPGEYGGGTVLLWDRGTWSASHDPAEGEEKGHLEIALAGERLNGRWHLVRMAKRPRDRTENWLLIKSEDSYARPSDTSDVLQEYRTSVISGRAMEEIAAGAAPRKRTQAPRKLEAAFPGFIPPALASLRDAAPTGERWIHEIKFDGYRLQAHVRGGGVSLLTRSGLDWTSRFGPRITDPLARSTNEAIFDGELVVEDAGGVSNFSTLQTDLSEGRTDRFVFYLFDLLFHEGEDLRDLPQIERKARLEALLHKADEPLRYSAHFDEEGEVMLRHACRLSLEGLVSKLRDEPYRSGRSRAWIKSKCLNRQEFVILGYVPSSTSSSAVGALLLGVRDEDELVPVGRVGTGFSHKVSEDLFGRLEPLRRSKPAFSGKPDAATSRQVRFTEPKLVVEVEFLGWTGDNTIRHATFRGLREDKPPEDIRRERDDGKLAMPVERPPSVDALSHPDRLYWSDEGVTKEGLADYYVAAWRFMAPHVINRPLALLRCPQGWRKHCFFQKHAWRGQSKKILRLTDPLDEGEDPTLVAIDDLPGLVGLVQGASLEIHSWQSSTVALEQPDQIVMDLDPDDAVDHDEVIAAAREVRERLAAHGLSSFIKTTGGKGYHVVSPLVPRSDWTTVKAFSKSIADGMAGDSPDCYVATISKAKRRGRILIDYLRNGRGATAVAPYSARSRAGATVSMPIEWDDLGPEIEPSHFTVLNVPAWLARRAKDPWEEFRAAAAPIPDVARRKRR